MSLNSKPVFICVTAERRYHKSTTRVSVFCTSRPAGPNHDGEYGSSSNSNSESRDEGASFKGNIHAARATLQNAWAEGELDYLEDKITRAVDGG